MAIKEWTTSYPTSQDSTPPTTEQPELTNETSPGSGDGDDTRVSQIHTLRDKLDAVCKYVGDASNLPAGCLKETVAVLLAAGASWDYLDLTSPAGFGSFEALYKFDNDGNHLEDRAGNGHTLSVATGTFTWAKRNGLVGWGAMGDTYLWTGYGRTGLQTAGALTVEILHSFSAVSAAQDVMFAVRGDPGSNNQAENTLVQLIADQDTGQHLLFQEYGSGVNVSDHSDSMNPIGAMQLTTMTRASDGVTCKLYVNGELLDTVVLSDAPDGGSNAGGWIGGVSSSAYFGFYAGLRYAKAEMSPAQVLEVYQRVRRMI